jgi:hypothetical protein
MRLMSAAVEDLQFPSLKRENLGCNQELPRYLPHDFVDPVRRQILIAFLFQLDAIASQLNPLFGFESGLTHMCASVLH